MSYWTFTDIFEENGPPFKPFHGGFGLMNLEGIRKPAFFAYRFLRQIAPPGAQDVATDDPQSWVTRAPDGAVQALVWDYSPVVPPAGQTDQSFYKKEVPAMGKGTLRIELDHLPDGRYQVAIYAIGYRENDAYTAYLKMGAPSQLTRAQVATLNEASSGLPQTTTVVDVHNGHYEDGLPMRSNEVYLLVLTPQHH
jgi:xylan 1,4-beta-xylosidase